MQYKDLREFINELEHRRLLKRISVAVNPHLEITEISQRTLKRQGPALIFENTKTESRAFACPVLTNLFGTVERVALGMGAENAAKLREIGHLLAFLKSPEPPQGFRQTMQTLPILRQALNLGPKVLKRGPCQDVVDTRPDLSSLPIQKCWPDDVGPLITWPLVITQGPNQKRLNLGIYRLQVIDSNRVIMRWLAHRGGALDYLAFRQANPESPYPVAIALGADPATILAAVTPIPDSLSEYSFAGLLRGKRTELVKGELTGLNVPASAEIILEGHIYPNDIAEEGPFGDHTGYYNEVERFPVLTIERMTHRENPIYHSTYTGRPPDEPAILGMALNEVFVPILQKQFSEIIDFYLPPEGCSYRVAIVSINKQYPGHAKRIMFGIWSFLKQFMYTKFIIIVDDDINTREWSDVIWALSTRTDPVRDMTLIENSPIDYLDFASPISGLGSKVGIDATNKWPGETQREWGRKIEVNTAVKSKVDQIWDQLGIFD